MRDEAVPGVDTVRQTLDCLIVTLVDVGESVATDGTRVDEVEGRGCLAWRHCNRPGGHGRRIGDCEENGDAGEVVG